MSKSHEPVRAPRVPDYPIGSRTSKVIADCFAQREVRSTQKQSIKTYQHQRSDQFRWCNQKLARCRQCIYLKVSLLFTNYGNVRRPLACVNTDRNRPIRVEIVNHLRLVFRIGHVGPRSRLGNNVGAIEITRRVLSSIRVRSKRFLTASIDQIFVGVVLQ
jgi:hypothetical protein